MESLSTLRSVNETTPVCSPKYAGIHEMKMELSLLLESLKFHMNCPDSQKTALSGLATILLHSDEAKEIFRKCGGLLFVRTLLTSVDSEQVKVAAIYTLVCAIEHSMLSKKQLCDMSMFRFLYSQLVSEESRKQLKIFSSFVILCLVTNNSEGQMLVRTSHCLDVLVNMFRSNDFKNSLLQPEDSHLLDEIKEEESSLKLWKGIASCLCGCVNNPQSVDNQMICASAFPAALSIIEKTCDQDIIRLILSFISLTVANNENNQERIGLIGGLNVLLQVFHNQVKLLEVHPSRDAMQMMKHIASTIVSCIEDNEDNKLLIADLHITHLLLHALSLDSVDTSTKSQLVNALVLCTESCEKSQKEFIEHNGVPSLVQLMANIQEEEFSKSATYLLHMCLDSQKSNSTWMTPETFNDKQAVEKTTKQPYENVMSPVNYFGFVF
ncbi:telomere repeats-binding bouquet formation protein 1-like [Antedon mediterranea]|uniref:telomere repeats-binding bouquet formation protein 1-like n=1 Tax=Antedon mediterranea TaxID=105859 RepID=UPI003AF9AD6C